MKQFNAIKAKYPDAMLLFRVGDFYETFGEDAIKRLKFLVLYLPVGLMARLSISNWPVFRIIRLIRIFRN